MTRRPLDIVAALFADLHLGLPKWKRDNLARAVLDALTTDPDVRERVETAIHTSLDAVSVCSHGDKPYATDCEVLADAVLAALRDEETR